MRRIYTRAAPLVFSGLAVSGCASGIAGSNAQVVCPPAVAAPVLYPGETWTFRYENGKRWRRTYDKMGEDGFLKACGARPTADYYYDQTHTLRKVFSNGTWVTAETPEFPAIGKPELEFPLTVGTTWTTVWHTDMRVPVYRGHSVAGCEQVTVPAGSFLAVRIEVDEIYTRSSGAVSRRSTLWYAPAVKYWVKRSGGSATYWDPVLGYELESFTIDDRKPATK